MKNRIISFMMALIMSAMVCGSTILPVLAVTPADPLIASAMYSFLVSAGIKIWRDGIEGSDTAIQDMISDMQTVWGAYKDDQGANVPSWEHIAGITTQSGNIILNYDTAQTFQAFADWLAAYKEMKPGNTYNLSSESSSGGSGWTLYTLPSDETAGLTNYNNGVWALPVASGSDVRAEYTYVSEDNANYRIETANSSSGKCFVIETNTEYYYYFCSTSEFIVNRSVIYPNAEQNNRDYTSTVTTTYQINGVSRPNDGNRFLFYMRSPEVYQKRYFSVSGPMNVATTTSGNIVAAEMAYVILAGDPVGTIQDLFATVGATVSSKVRDLVEGQSLVIDVGASSGANEEEVVGVAAGSYEIPATAEVVPSAVAYPLPVAGVSELYPQAEAAGDVDDLGLPALGQALTSRFPFCIPWDVVYLYQSLNAAPKRPVFTIDVIPQSLKQKIGIHESTAFTLDFGDERFSIAVKLVRWGTLVGFVLFLAFTTKRLIWTTGG